MMACYVVAAQEPYLDFATQILHNNVDMRVLLKRCMADSAAAVGGSLFDNPEVEFAYYDGSPSSVGIRWDLSVTQHLRMPTYYVAHNRQRSLKQDEARIDFSLSRRALQTRIEMLCSDMVLLNALYSHYGQCEAKAQALGDAYRRSLDEGECTVIEYNSIMMMLTQIHGKLSETEIQRNEKLSELSMLNGGMQVAFTQDTFAIVSLPSDIERYADSVVAHGTYALHRGNIIGQYANAVSVARSEWLPSIGVGYASENTVGETFRGGVLSLTLPLWNNARRVSGAKLEQQAATEQHANDQAIERQKLLQCYHKAAMLQKTIATLQKSLSAYNSEALLHTALKAGEITVQHYLQQWEAFHDANLSLLTLQHELDHTVIQLYSME